MKTDSIARQSIAERFASDIAGHKGTYTRRFIRPHEMTVKHDDGLYRHLLFKSPDTSIYWFELVTWPGRLSIHGDLGDSYTFARVPDMFTFFRRHEVNPVYWSEKLDGDSSKVRVYSEDVFRRNVWDHVRSHTQGRPAPGLAKAVHAHFFGEYAEYNLDYEEEARAALDSFEYHGPDQKPFQFDDAWEWDCRDWDWSFLWACHAIVWGIARYDEARLLTSAALPA